VPTYTIAADARLGLAGAGAAERFKFQPYPCTQKSACRRALSPLGSTSSRSQPWMLGGTWK